MSTSFGKSFDGFYGTNLTTPISPVAIEAGGYNHTFDSTEQAETQAKNLGSTAELNQYALSDWYQSQELTNSDEITIQVKVKLQEPEFPEKSSEVRKNNSILPNQTDSELNTEQSEAEIMQIGVDLNLETEMTNDSEPRLSAEQSQKLAAIRYNPKINFQKVLRF